MQRPIIYSLEEIRSYDIAWGWKDSLYAIAWLAQNILGNTNTVLQGFGGTQTSPTSLAINVAPGWIYQQAVVDSTVYGPLPADATVVTQQGYYSGGQLTFVTSGLSSGQSQYALVEVTFNEVDSIPASDPNEGVLPYINPANPSVPFQGPNNSGSPQDTLRSGVATVQIKYGTPASTGSEVPPSADSGYVPLYLVILTYGQTTITTGQIQIAGPGVYSGYPYAPLFPGVTGTIPGGSGSHHGGIAGQANKILLTGGAEVQGLASLSNLPVSNSSPPVAGGNIVVGGEIPILTQGNVAPSGNVAGNASDYYFNQTTGFLYICTTSGSASTAVWQQVGPGGLSQYINSFPLVPAAGGYVYLCDTSAGNKVVNLPTAASMGGTLVILVNIGANQLTINPQSGESIQFQSAGTAVVIYNQGESIKLAPRSAVGWYYTP